MDTQSFLHDWCLQNGLNYNVNFRITGPEDRQNFLCEVRVDKRKYVGVGISAIKKEAQDKAVKNFIDINAEMHGYWTIENAKCRLHTFLQYKNISRDYTFTVKHIDFKRISCAELSICLKKDGINIIAEGTGSNKQEASKSCALSAIRQLFHLGVIEAFDGSSKSDKTVAYDVCISPELENEIFGTLKELNIKSVRNDYNSSSNSIPQILLTPKIQKLTEERGEAPGVISWSPPQPNWNTWASCSIDEEPLATATLQDISNELLKLHRDLMQNGTLLVESLRAREKLPVFKMRRQIMEATNNNPVIIIKGNAGCGKTTQVAQFILDDYIYSGRGAWCNICVTQPHRISAVSASIRVADERCEDLGKSVGYSVRFESVFPRPYASILFSTVDVLLHQMEDGLRGISHVIVDEIHERDVGSDFMLILLRDMIHMNPDLRVILMSPTIDTSLFSQYFGDCPVLEVPSQMYPVQQFFLEDCLMLCSSTSLPNKPKKKPCNQSDVEDDDQITNEETKEDLNRASLNPNYSNKTSKAMAMLSNENISYELIVAILSYINSLNQPGAILIFVPESYEVSNMIKFLQQHPVFGGSNYEILPLHSQISKEDLKKVFIIPPLHVTKVIIATNIAETSITVNDVVFVIDLAKSRIKLFTLHKNMTSYVTAWARRTNLKQRKSCAGRMKSGYCFTLCSKARFYQLNEHQPPGMSRVPLHQLALSIKLLQLGTVDQVLSKALEPPVLDTVIYAKAFLRELQCLDAQGSLTPLGRILAKLPIEPRLGKMMIMSTMLMVADPLMCILAYNSIFFEIFTLKPGERHLSYHQQALAGDRHSDYIAMLMAYQMWDKERKKGEEQEIRFCESKGLQLTTMRIICEAKYQLSSMLIDAGFPEECFSEQYWEAHGPDPKLDLVIALLCMGFYPNVCWHKSKRKVLTTERKGALIHKTSVNSSNINQVFPSPFFVFGEKVRNRAVSCKQTNMVAPLHLLLFGCQKVEWIDGVVRLDNWINFKMNPKHAAAILALRPAIEKLIDYAAQNPQNCLQLDSIQKKVLGLVKKICMMNSGDYQIQRESPTSLHLNKRPMMNISSIGNKSPASDNFEKCPRMNSDTFDNSQQSSTSLHLNKRPMMNISSIGNKSPASDNFEKRPRMNSDTFDNNQHGPNNQQEYSGGYDDGNDGDRGKGYDIDGEGGYCGIRLRSNSNSSRENHADNEEQDYDDGSRGRYDNDRGRVYDGGSGRNYGDIRGRIDRGDIRRRSHSSDRENHDGDGEQGYNYGRDGDYDGSTGGRYGGIRGRNDRGDIRRRSNSRESHSSGGGRGYDGKSGRSYCGDRGRNYDSGSGGSYGGNRGKSDKRGIRRRSDSNGSGESHGGGGGRGYDGESGRSYGGGRGRNYDGSEGDYGDGRREDYNNDRAENYSGDRRRFYDGGSGAGYTEATGRRSYDGCSRGSYGDGRRECYNSSDGEDYGFDRGEDYDGGSGGSFDGDREGNYNDRRRGRYAGGYKGGFLERGLGANHGNFTGRFSERKLADFEMNHGRYKSRGHF